MTERDNVINMQDWLEKKSSPNKHEIRKRIADIAIEIMLLESEKQALERQLGNDIP